MKPSRVEASRGSAIVTALCLVLGLLLFSIAFLLLPWQEYQLNHRVYLGTVALNLAEAGVEYTCWAISSTGNIADWSGTSPKTRIVTGFKTVADETKGDFAVRAWATPNAPNPKPVWLVESTGSTQMLARDDSEKDEAAKWKMQTISRTVKALCVPAIVKPFSGVFLGDRIVTLGGSLVTDSYDSRIGAYGDASLPYSNVHRGAPGTPDEGKGDIATNGTGDPAIDLANNITVYGDIMTGDGGTVSGGATVVGDTTHDFSQELPYKTAPSDVTYEVQPGDGVLALKTNASYIPGNYKFAGISLSGTANLTFNGPAIVWVTGSKGQSIKETGSAVITCVGRVEFYLDEDASLAGNGIMNPGGLPIDCSIYATEDCNAIYIGGSNSFYGSIYAPNADVKLAGSEDKYGAFVGKTITVQGGTEYHYDEALGEVALQGGKYTLRYWQEM